MASALMRRSAVTALLAAAATIASPLAGVAFAAAPPLTAATFSTSPADSSGTVKANQPTFTATYNTPIDASSTIALTDTTASNAAVSCPGSVSGSAISCKPSSSLTDGHSYTVTVHAVNASNPPGDSRTDTKSYTIDIPSLVSISPKDGDVVGSGSTAITATYDEALDPSSYIKITNSNGNSVQGGSLSHAGGDPSGLLPKDTISYSPPNLPAGTYEAQVHAVAQGNSLAYADTFINYTVNPIAPTRAPTVTTAGATMDGGATHWINSSNEDAVPFAGKAEPNVRVHVVIYDKNVVTPVGCNHTTKLCSNDRDASVGVVDCGGALCDWSLRVDTTTGGGTADKNYQYLVYAYTAGGTFPTSVAASSGDPTMGKDTAAPPFPLGGSLNISADLASVTDSDADLTVFSYKVVLADGYGNSVTRDNIRATVTNPPPPGTPSNDLSVSGIDISSLEDGAASTAAPAIKASIYAYDQAGNISAADPGAPTAPHETTTLTPDLTHSYVTVDGNNIPFSAINGASVHTPTSITIRFNEPIRSEATTSGNNPPLYTTNLELHDASPGGGFPISGSPHINADNRSFTWTLTGTPTDSGSPYSITKVEAVSATCPNTNATAGNCEEWPHDTTGQAASDTLVSFSIDNTAPSVNVTGVNAGAAGANNGMNADNLGSTVISGIVDADATSVTLAIKPASGSTVVVPGPSDTITITPPASGASVATWHTSALNLSSIADGTATITASASDAAGNHSPIDPTAANPDTSSRSLATSVHARPDAPQNLNVLPGSGSASLSWVAPVYTGAPDKTITSYVLSYTDTSVAGSSAQPGPSISGAATTATVTGLANGHTYSFALAASNGSYTGAPATRSATPKGNTALVLSVPRWIVYGHSVALRGYLTYAGVGVGNERISVTPVYYNGKHGPTVTATTDQFGNWSAGTVKPAKNVTYVASFAGDNAYNASSTSHRVLVKARVRLSKVTAKSRSHLSPVTFRGSVAPNMHHRWVYVYEKVGRKLHKLGRVRLTSRSTWSFTHTFGKGTHYVFAKFLTQNGNQGNVSGTAKFRRT